MNNIILDACCGSRMFWFDRENSQTIFMDKRREAHQLPDASSRGGLRKLVIDPNLQADFSALPFASNTFAMVVFDPPHLVKAGKNSWLAKKYGKLTGDWRTELAAGFQECFRVLRPAGTLIFKWSEYNVPLSKILTLTNYEPLLGHRSGKAMQTHWLVFMKETTP